MPAIMAAFYDWIMSGTEAGCLRAWRSELLEGAEGRVLELGAGTGANLAFYGREVRELLLLEPDPHMRQRLASRVQPLGPPAQILSCGAERLPVETASVDTIVSTLVCCTVGDPSAVLSECFRVLKPGGRLLFIEHVAAEDRPDRLLWQQRIEPLWRVVAGGCHLTRRTADTMVEVGFALEQLTRESMRKAPPFVRPSIRGVARKR